MVARARMDSRADRRTRRLSSSQPCIPSQDQVDIIDLFVQIAIDMLMLLLITLLYIIAIGFLGQLGWNWILCYTKV